MPPRGLMIAAPRSGSGKTTVTLGLVAAIARRGIAVRAAKAGPDYIDPAFLAAAAGAPCFNLDSWAMPPSMIASLLSRGGEVTVVEAAMGLFDGVSAAGQGAGRSGASADIAAAARIPVVLVLDISGQSQTAACVARGFVGYAPDVRIAGVILNRCGSDRHRDAARAAIEAVGLPVLGALPRCPDVTLPERHLGLIQAEEHDGLDAYLAALASIAERHLDIDALVALASPIAMAAGDAAAMTPPGQRVALARDAAFSFVYPHLLHAWRDAGAEICLFSPLADEAPPSSCDVCWLPGGYPELHAPALAAAARFRDGVRHFAQTRPVHGECGGYMVLGERLEDANGDCHQMAGLLGHQTSFAKRRLSLGYRRTTLLADCALGLAGRVLLGHEFHYATLRGPAGDAPLCAMSDGRGAALGAAGGVRGRVSGSFFHVLAGAVEGG